MKPHIAVLDFGSQYTHLIARRIRELGVHSRIYPPNTRMKELAACRGIILSGGPRSVVRDPVISYDPQLFDMKLPVLGLCYGHQLMAHHFGGAIARGSEREYGTASLSAHPSPIFRNVPHSSTVWMSHGDHVDALPPHFSIIGSSETSNVTAMANHAEQLYGFQFHPEVHHSRDGMIMLENFLFNICRATKNWTTDSQLNDLLTSIKEHVGQSSVFLLLSGGVDSTVSYALLEKALGKNRVYGLHVDHGLLRKDESQQVAKALSSIGITDLHIYDAKDMCFSALSGVTDPEQKRNIIGELFVDIATEQIQKVQSSSRTQWLLGQGTIYPDTIESGDTVHAETIKTHHNRVKGIQDMIDQGLVIEPLRDLYKDEVRNIGRLLGLPDALIDRHPFPGPGLGIRCLCSHRSNEKPTVVAPTLVTLPIRSVGVQGDERTYAHPAVILADHYHWDRLALEAPRITNTHENINRVLALLRGTESQLLSSHLWQKSITPERISILQHLDAVVSTLAKKDPLYEQIWQFPVVLIPFGFDRGESLVLRPVSSKEAMTVSFARLEQQTLDTIVSHTAITSSVDFVFYDVTNKPPGTIEWE